MANKSVLKNIWIIGSLLFTLGMIIACNFVAPSQSELPVQITKPTAVNTFQPSEPSIPQEDATLPATSLREQPTSTVGVVKNHRVSAEELALNLNWGGWGAGGSFENDCGDGIPNIYFITFGGSIEPPSPEVGNKIAIGESVIIKGCDFPINDQIIVTYHIPNGNTEQDDQQANEMGNWSARWISVPGEPTGRYEVDVESTSGTFAGDFTVNTTVKPTMAVICLPNNNEGTVVLTGFQPDEEVAVARYGFGDPMTTDSNLIDYSYITVDHNGSVIFQIPNEEALIIAIGQVTQYTRGSGANSDVDLRVSAFDFCESQYKY